MKKLTLTIASAAIVLGFGSAASAQDGYSGDVENPVAVESAVPAAPAAPAAPAVAAPATDTQAVATQQLPVTGGEATGMALLGTALVAGGGLLVWRSKGAEATA